MSTSQFAVYQLKKKPELRNLLFRTYEELVQDQIPVQVANYEQVYLGTMKPGETPEQIKKDLEQKQPRLFQQSTARGQTLGAIVISRNEKDLDPKLQTELCCHLVIERNNLRCYNRTIENIPADEHCRYLLPLSDLRQLLYHPLLMLQQASAHQADAQVEI